MVGACSVNNSNSSTAYSGRFLINPTTNVVRFNAPPQRVLISESPWPGRESIKARLDELCRLERGWDGYGAPPVSFLTANFALGMLSVICNHATPEPQVVPGVSGDLQVEWHTAELDIELHVKGPNDVHAWMLVRGEDEGGQESHLTNDFALVKNWIDKFLEPPLAASTSAA
jgi:hypothetical protein